MKIEEITRWEVSIDKKEAAIISKLMYTNVDEVFEKLVRKHNILGRCNTHLRSKTKDTFVLGSFTLVEVEQLKTKFEFELESKLN